MPAPKPTLSRSEFDAHFARTGLPLTEEQKSAYYAVYGYIEAISERVRAGGHRPREAEPAHVFKPTGR